MTFPPLDLALFGKLTSKSILLVDDAGTITGATPLAGRLLGRYAPADGSSWPVGSRLRDLVIDGEGLDEYVARCRRSGEPLPGSMMVELKDGERWAILSRGCRVSARERHVALALQSAAVDDRFVALTRQLHRAAAEISRRRAAEEELFDAKERLALVLSSTAEGIVGLGLEGEVTFCNSAALRLLGYDREDELLGRDAMSLLFPAEPDQDPTGPRSRLTPRGTKELRRDHDIFWRRDGTSFPAEFRMRRMKIGDEMVGTVVSFTDVTEELQADEEHRAFKTVMQQAQRLESLGSLAGNIAHDFNNLLLTILGNADLARRRLPESSPVRANLDGVLAASNSASDLCRQLLTFSGRRLMPVQPLSLSKLVREMMSLLNVSISKNVDMSLQVSPDETAIYGHASQVRQVVMNLLVNASDAIGEAVGTIEIRIGSIECSSEMLRSTLLRDKLEAGTYTYLEILDSGIGMDAEQLERVFDPFFSTKESGHGLGLAAVLGIVRTHRGAIEVDSTPGRGTRFRLLFPAATLEAEDPDEETPGGGTWRGTGTILVVDDKRGVAKVVAGILEDIDFSVLIAENGEQAIEIFTANRRQIVAVVLDIHMPKLGGFEAFRKLRQLDPNVRVVMSSGVEEESTLPADIAEGLAAFLPKPYSRDHLVGTLRRVLEHGRQEGTLP